MGNKNRNRVKKSISPFVKWGKWGGDGVKAFVYAIIFTIVGSDGTAYYAAGHGAVPPAAPVRLPHRSCGRSRRLCDPAIWGNDRLGDLRRPGHRHVSDPYAGGDLGQAL